MNRHAAVLAGWMACRFCTYPASGGDAPGWPPPYPHTSTANAEANGASSTDDVADRLQADISERWFDLVDRIDRLFGDERIEDDVRGSQVRCGVGLRWDRADGWSLQTRVRSRVDLPRTEQRLQLIFDNLTETEDPLQRSPIADTVDTSRPDTGLRFLVRETARVRLSTDLGARLGEHPQAFGRLRMRYVRPLGSWELRLTETAQWYTSDGFVVSGEMRWSRLLRDGWIFRSSTRLTWEQERDGVTPSQTIHWLYAPPHARGGHRFTISAEWPETPSGGYSSYGVEYAYRRLLGRPWLAIEFAPGLSCRESRNFEPDPRCTIMVEVIFGALEPLRRRSD